MSKKLRKRGIKFLSSLLAFTIFVTYITIGEFSPVLAESNNNENIQNKNPELVVSDSRKEVKEKRTENSKTFLNPDGTYTSEISQTPIHFKNENKQWETINNQLVSDSQEKVYENKANDFTVKFDERQESGSPIMQIEDNQYSTELQLEPLEHTGQKPASVEGLVEGESITYPNVYSDIDLKYSVGSDRIKEDIIYNEKPEEGFPSEFTYKMDLEGMNVKNQDGILYLCDSETNELLYYFETPYMYDSFIPEGFKTAEGITSIPEESISYDVTLKHEIIDNQLYLHLAPNKQWLEDETRIYPLTIDPTIVRIQSSTHIEDTSLRSTFPTQTGGNDLEIGGGASNDNVIRSLLKFDVSTIPTDITILSSSLDLWFSSTNNSSMVDVSLYKMGRDWNENEASWNYAKTSPSTSWTTKGGDYISSNKLATVSGLTNPTTLDNDMKQWDIPIHIIQNWKDNPSTNYGFMIKSDTEATNSYKKFISSEHTADSKYKPLFVVTYRTNARLGLEEYWMYDSHPLVGGTSFSNLTTNNNVIQYTDYSITGRGGFGLDFTRTYNSKSKESSVMGYGWTFTGNEKLFLNIKQTANILNYQDEDGTDHEFVYDIPNAIYKSGPGKYLTIKKSSSDSNIYIMVDKYGIKTTFKILQASNDTDVRVAYIQSKEDRHGNKIKYAYENNRITKIISELGSGVAKTLQFTYNAAGYIETAEYEGGKFTYHYDATGKMDYVDQLKNSNLSVNTRTKFGYKNDRIGTIIDPEGRLTDYTYDPNGYLIKVQDPKDGNPNDSIDRPGIVYDIDIINNKSTVTGLDGNLTTYYFDSNYVPIKEEIPGSSTTYTPDSNYNPIRIVEDGNIITNIFDSNGNLLRVTNSENHKEVVYTYTTFSRLETITELDNMTKTTYTYVDLIDGGEKVTINSDGKDVTNTYDSYGDLKSVKYPDGSIDIMDINYASNKTTTTHTDEFKNVTKTESDTLNNTETITDGRDNPYSLHFNDKFELDKVIDQKDKETSYNYDENGNLITVTNAKKKLFLTYDYNGQNLLVKETNALGKSINYDYYEDGNIKSILLPNDHKVSYVYESNRMIQKNINDLNKFDFNYDPLSGNLTSVKMNNNLQKSIIYNNDDSIDYIIDRTNKLDYTEEDSKKITTYTVESNETKLEQSLDSMSRVNDIHKNGDTNSLVSYEYHYEDLPSSVSFNNGSSIQMEYLHNRLDTYTLKTKNSNILDSYKFGYDKNNNITTITSNLVVTTYSYDDKMDYLKEENLTDGTKISYEYDEVGNRTIKRTTRAGETNTIPYEYNDGNQLMKVGNQIYQYDDNGNLKSDGKNSYVFNDINQIESIEDQSGQIIAKYTYDEDGKRISSITPLGTINYFYEGDNVLYETDENNKILREYTYNGNGQVGTLTKNGQTYYYLYNHHGDVIALTDSAGNIVASYSYDAWGNVLSQSGPMASDNPYRYAGYRYDENTKLYYLMSRYYNPDNGVFLSIDLVRGDLENPITQNGYNYANNNPVMNVDPNGKWSVRADVFANSVDAILSLIPSVRIFYSLVKTLGRTGKPYQMLNGDKIVPQIVKSTNQVFTRFNTKLKISATIMGGINTFFLTMSDFSIGKAVAYVLGRMFKTEKRYALKYIYWGPREKIIYIIFPR